MVGWVPTPSPQWSASRRSLRRADWRPVGACCVQIGAPGVLDRKADGDAPRWLETVGAYLTSPTKVDTLAAAMIADAVAVPEDT